MKLLWNQPQKLSEESKTKDKESITHRRRKEETKDDKHTTTSTPDSLKAFKNEIMNSCTLLGGECQASVCVHTDTTAQKNPQTHICAEGLYNYNQYLEAATEQNPLFSQNCGLLYSSFRGAEVLKCMWEPAEAETHAHYILVISYFFNHQKKTRRVLETFSPNLVIVNYQKHDVGKEGKNRKENIITSACNAMHPPHTHTHLSCPLLIVLFLLLVYIQRYSSCLASLHVPPLPISSHRGVLSCQSSVALKCFVPSTFSCWAPARGWYGRSKLRNAPNNIIEKCVYTLSIIFWVTLIMMIHKPGCLVPWSTRQDRGSLRVTRGTFNQPVIFKL